ncbi:MAG: pentapeptide repeat-containing protein [Cyanobacteria bacterium J06581_3]
MAVLREFGDWLKGGLKLPWGELANQTINATKATADLSKTWQEAAPKLAALKDLDRLDSFFKLFDSPVGKLAVSGLPFASLGIDLLKLYFDVTKTEPTLESSVALAAQIAYLESLAAVLERAEEDTKARLLSVKLVAVFERQLEKAETVPLSKTRAKRTLTQLRTSELVEAFDEALGELLNEAGLAGWQVRVLVDQAAWGMPKYFYGVVPELKEAVAPLAEFLRSDGLRIEEKFGSVEDYLKEKIEPLPRQKVFDETTVSFGNLYVPLMVQPLDVSGNAISERPVGIHTWAENLLEQAEPRQVGFIEGGAGRGKSVFCRMFAAAVHLDLYSTFIPILIRLRDVRKLESNLTQTLETHLQVEYLKEKLFASESSVDELVPLFQRLRQFYEDWCEGLFVDSVPSGNWPQIKMMQLKAAEIDTGLRQVDIYTGMNALLLLFVLHGYGQQQVKEDEKSPLNFHPCGDPDSNAMDNGKLLRMIRYSQLIRPDYLAFIVWRYLSAANLRGADLRGVNLSSANLSSADLRGVNLNAANLRIANLQGANLQGANLQDANLNAADLSGANLCGASLQGADLIPIFLYTADLARTRIYANFSELRFDKNTDWEGVRGLETAKNVPDALKQQLGLT